MRVLIARVLACGAILSATLDARPPQPQVVTFSADIAPIVFAHCAGCHHPQGAAPFSLLTYGDVRRRATLIAQATRARLMPPWKSEPGYGDFIGHRHLADRQIALIEQWVANGAPEGDARDLPPAPTWIDGWQLGLPSLTVTFPDPVDVPADGPDFSRIFVLRLPVTSPAYVNGFEFRPGGDGVVHHANIRIDRTPRSRELDQQDPAPGYSGLLLSSAVYPDGHFLGWTPGQVAPLLRKGLAWRLAPGTDLVVEIHFVPNGRAQPVQPAIAFYFTDDAPERSPAMLRLGRQNLDIPAGEKRYVISDSFVLPVDVDVQAVQPHAHYRAREVKATAALPDGTSTPLIYIKDWDYRWQHVYAYLKPPRLPRGSRIDVQYVFDNSADNPRNPQQPPQRVRWGQRSIDEMGDLWVQLLTTTDQDLRTLQAALQTKHVAEEIIGYETMIRSQPDHVPLRNDIAVLYIEMGRADKALPHLEASVRLQPNSPGAHYNLGTALSATGNVAGAIRQYQDALRLRPEYPLAHNNLGHALLALSRVDEARRHFEEAVRLDPTYAEALYNLAAAQAASGQSERAVVTCEKALALIRDEPLARAVRQRCDAYRQHRIEQ